MTTSDGTATVREAVGVFGQPDNVQGAMADLLASGFQRKSIGMLAAEHTVRDLLSDHYAEVAEAGQGQPDGPKMAFVEKETQGDPVRSGSGLFFAGATAAAGAAVASAGVLGGALLAAVSGVGAVGAIGAGLAMLIKQTDAEYLEEQVNEGHLLLFVRTATSSQQERAQQIMGSHDAMDVRICTVTDSG